MDGGLRGPPAPSPGYPIPGCRLPYLTPIDKARAPGHNPAMFLDQQSGDLRNGIVKVRYSHDAMIDLIVAEPTVRQNDLAVIFDRTPAWISQVINSDAFQARLEERKAELIDPVIMATIKDRLSAVANASLEKILERVVSPVTPTDDFLLESAKLATKALGYGARETGGGTNVAVVVQVPPRIPSATEWLSAHSPSQGTP